MKTTCNKVHIIGIGPGAEDYLLPIAKRVIENADCLIGAKRLISLFSGLGKKEFLIEGHFDDAITYIKKQRARRKIAVLVSGDPGMYSLLGKLSKEFSRRDYTVVPGISTVQFAFARLGQSWHDARIISLHGREVKNLAKLVKDSPKVFLLTDAHMPPEKIAKHLLQEGLENRKAIILENLSSVKERVIESDLRRISRTRGWGLCAMIIETKEEKAKKGKLYGVGLGPGDPNLVTVKAKEILDRVNTVFVPKASEDGSSLARSVVDDIVTTEKNFIELTFPMTTDKSILNKYWLGAARVVAKEIKKGKEAVFVTIGDPFIYSTYAYLLRILRQNFPDIDVETVPGVSAFNAASSRAQLPLVEGYERLAVVPVTGDLKGLREALMEFDTVVLMKIGSKLDKIILLLKELGLAGKAVLISRVGHKNEKIIYDLTSLKDKKIGYLSVILVRKDWKK